MPKATSKPRKVSFDRAAADRNLSFVIEKIRNSDLYNELGDTSLHGKGHAERVLLLAYALVHLVRHRFETINVEVITAAALLHDVGRLGDGVEPGHGLSSAGKVRAWIRRTGLALDEDLLYQAILWHCPPPDMGTPQNMPIEADIIGDADKLDRFRLGGRRPLEVKALALPESRLLVNLAARLNGHRFRLKF